jgi:hypothetical protein
MRIRPAGVALCVIVSGIFALGACCLAASGSPTLKQIADANAVEMMAEFTPPPGAQPSGPIPIAALLTAPSGATSSGYATVTAWYRVPCTMQCALAWVVAHTPAGFTLDGSSSGPTFEYYVMSLPPIPRVLTVRELYVTVTDDGKDGTAMRVDSQVSWLPPVPV